MVYRCFTCSECNVVSEYETFLLIFNQKIRTVVFLDGITVMHNIRRKNAFLIRNDGLDDLDFPVSLFNERQTIEEFRDAVEKIMILM